MKPPTKYLVPAPRHSDGDCTDPCVTYADDVQRLVQAAHKQGYEVSARVAAELWIRYSESRSASWLMMDGVTDENLLRGLLQEAVVVDTATSGPTPPQGYASWLDYAVQTMDTRSPYLEQFFVQDAPEVSREAMLEAAAQELIRLRQLAGLGT
jgi:hypothetical protein